ncbi:hypothetical protein E2562_023347 [Oryza meyeriana var. granulata]|uniref:Uncharacterized protein n=1 Tax=Oryza meyeriana var. granulata TaxID=110450 RepID=A0A6G1DZG0_9ORYZ|nr:hypothetical protein E2562_023347 [Oryza meyeriana var. granulata]
MAWDKEPNEADAFCCKGIAPDSWFPDRSNWLRLIKLPTSEGRGPERELLDRSKYKERDANSKISFGIELLRQGSIHNDKHFETRNITKV